jgi:hypothetical protein
MQNDYQTEVNHSHNGCADGNNGTVQGDEGTMAPLTAREVL